MIKTLRYRGYDISETFDNSRDDFESMYGNLSLAEVKKCMSQEFIIDATDELPKILVVWLVDRKLGANTRDIKDALELHGSQHALVVADEGVTPQAKETLRALRATKKIYISVWTLPETMIFTPDHEYVPAHRVCTARERRKILTDYGSSKDKLPQIQHSDIMIRYLGATKNQLIEIKRPCETYPGQFTIYYRIVV